MKTFEEYNYVIKNNILAFQKGPLSNFFGAYKNQGKSPQIVTPSGEFNCVEQYYMYQKARVFRDTESMEKILAEKNPNIQKELGRAVKNFSSEYWEGRKELAMDQGLTFKFFQNPELADFLLSTENLTLVEAAPWDKSWGCGTGPDDPRTFDQKQWQGENLLGKWLMIVREDLRYRNRS